MQSDIEARAASDMPERVGDESLADADGAEHDDVAQGLDEPETGELLEHASIECDLRCLIPSLEDHVGVEPSVISAACSGGAAPTLNLVGEQAEQEVLDGQLVFL